MGKNIILMGFMGSGKTTTGIRLSYLLRRAFVDTDKLIEMQEGKTVSEIFASEGESAFRQLETQMLEKLLQQKSRNIISIGGGTPMREENRRLLHQLGKVIYLEVSPETVYSRLSGDTTRPLLQGENPMGKIRELMEARAETYREAADAVLDCNQKDMTEIISEIERICK